MSIARLTPVFSAVFALAYIVAVEFNIAVVTYHPKTGEWDLWTQPARNGPAMYWYGWLITAALAAIAACAIVLPLARDRDPPTWVGWAIPLAVMASFLYFLRSFFIY